MNTTLRSFSSLLILPLFFACESSSKQVEVNGTISGLDEKQIFLEELGINNVVVVDSGMTDNKGNFKLEANKEEPALYRLRMPGDHYILLSLDGHTATVKGDINKMEAYEIAGSAPSESLRKYLAAVRNYMTDFNTLYIVMDSMKAQGKDSMLAMAQVEMTEKNVSLTKYIQQYADTTAYLPNALLAVQMLNPKSEKEYLQAFSSKVEKRFPNTNLGKEFNEKFQQMMASLQEGQQPAAVGVEIGSMAPEIALKDENGKEKKLSDLKGKFVLIDFWASWCAPCRAENPNVVAAYEKMKGKNFTILGVSLDNDQDKWVAAIKEDNLGWEQVSDLKGWQSIAARDYSIQSIPANFLLDPQGKVIATNLRGDDLEETLAELVK